MRRNVIPAAMATNIGRLHDRLSQTRRERDDALAEVERLRDELHAIPLDWVKRNGVGGDSDWLVQRCQAAAATQINQTEGDHA